MYFWIELETQKHENILSNNNNYHPTSEYYKRSIRAIHSSGSGFNEDETPKKNYMLTNRIRHLMAAEFIFHLSVSFFT